MKTSKDAEMLTIAGSARILPLRFRTEACYLQSRLPIFPATASVTPYDGCAALGAHLNRHEACTANSKPRPRNIDQHHPPCVAHVQRIFLGECHLPMHVTGRRIHNFLGNDYDHQESGNRGRSPLATLLRLPAPNGNFSHVITCLGDKTKNANRRESNAHAGSGYESGGVCTTHRSCVTDQAGRILFSAERRMQCSRSSNPAAKLLR